MPPMLDIALLELTGSAEEEMLTHENRVCMYERHHVLQLVPETESAPRLVVSAAGPETAHYSLVQEPAIGQEMYGLVGCLHLHCAKRVIPVLPYRFERVTRRSRTPETTHQFAGVIGIPPCSEPEDNLALLPVGQIEWNLDSGAWIQSRSCLAGETQPMHRCRISKCAIAPDELSPVAADGPGHFIHIEEGNPAGKLRIVSVPGKERTAVGINFGDYMHCRYGTQGFSKTNHFIFFLLGGASARVG